jgi:hypothetical protein
MNEQLAHLRREYTFGGNASLISEVLADVPALYPLLTEAVSPIQAAFGQEKRLHLEALESDDDKVLRVIIRLPLNTPRAGDLMRQFKQEWWLENCSRSEASLVFDYETGNGI